jgi:hypothetical protein
MHDTTVDVYYAKVSTNHGVNDWKLNLFKAFLNFSFFLYDKKDNIYVLQKDYT